VTTDLDGLYAAQRLSMVRLALLLVGDRDLAEMVVQGAFLVMVRRSDRRGDPGALVAELRTRVVGGCRAVRRGRRTAAPPREPPRPGGDAADEVLALSPREREVVVLEVWSRLSRSQTAATLLTGERSVAAAWATALGSLRRADEPTEAVTVQRLAEALERRADVINADDLLYRFVEVLDEDDRRTARHRRWWLVVVALVIAVALVTAAVVGPQRYSPSPPTPVPSPPPSTTLATSPLSSPALAPGEHTRGQVPWAQVGAGWALVATATPATAVTTTLMLVGPDGSRYALGSAAEGLVIQDVSADGRHVMVAIGAEAEDWDLAAGTAQQVVTPYGWKSVRYAGPDPSFGYLVMWIDSSSSVRLSRWAADGSLRTGYDTSLASTAGGPRHPGVLVASDGSRALLSSRDGPLLQLDLASDAVAGPGPFVQAPTCEPLAKWSRTEVLTGCGSSTQVNTYDDLVGRPVLVNPAGSAPISVAMVWQTAGPDIVQLDDLCSTSLGSILDDRRVTPIAVTGPAVGLVPNAAVGRTLYLGGTRCAADGDRFVGYDVATGRVTELVGPHAGGRTVRQATVLGPAS
jgi:DNA-directed RNA polymerase specialized sigma24 family protein